MSQMTKKMAEAGSGQVPQKTPGTGVGNPKQGDRFRCAKCGMAIEVKADCRCTEPDMSHFHCCGQEMQKQ